MNKLTEDQVKNIAELSEQRTELYLEQNKVILFDIKKVTNKGKEIRAELDNLILANELVKQTVKKQFEDDIEKVRKFLGEFADALVVSEDERYGNYYYSIGANDDNKVHVTYAYGREDFKDWNNFVEIDGSKREKYVQYEIDCCADGYGNEYHADFEKMFNDSDVVQMFEIALQDYIVYGNHKKAE